MNDFMDKWTWSFTRATSYEQCPYQFYMHYIKDATGLDNYNAQAGEVAHSTLEHYLKGELSIFEVNDYFNEMWMNVVTAPSIPDQNGNDPKDSLYKQLIDYFNTALPDVDGYDILGVEKKMTFNIGSIKFLGIIDVLLRDKGDGRLVVIDHKTYNAKFLKSGDLSKQSREHFAGFKKQLLLYSLGLSERPKELAWNLLKNKRIVRLPFNRSEQEEAEKWFVSVVDAAKRDKKFTPNPDYFFCNHLCEYRSGENSCPYRLLDIVYMKCKDDICGEWESNKNKFFEWAIKEGFNTSDNLELVKLNENQKHSPENSTFIENNS